MLVLDSDEVNDLKHGQEALRQQLRDIKLANRDMKNAAKVVLWGIRV
ncbi:hypothetical protein [Erwinia sorbitola]|uniref:Uncharacterized protein n=1 Tax=Erwinia sorbitola TaxID=2681984 RepID=A0A6I6EJB1_9GAMM|nr:hypothetical protein [Erwinia sorbitola]QGU88095.1 hypothetical protein GN242_13050 [Erwinia sorbitola]